MAVEMRLRKSIPAGMSKLLLQSSQSRLPALMAGLGLIAGGSAVLLRRMQAEGIEAWHGNDCC